MPKDNGMRLPSPKGEECLIPADEDVFSETNDFVEAE